MRVKSKFDKNELTEKISEITGVFNYYKASWKSGEDRKEAKICADAAIEVAGLVKGFGKKDLIDSKGTYFNYMKNTLVNMFHSTYKEWDANQYCISASREFFKACAFLSEGICDLDGLMPRDKRLHEKKYKGILEVLANMEDYNKQNLEYGQTGGHDEPVTAEYAEDYMMISKAARKFKKAMFCNV